MGACPFVTRSKGNTAQEAFEAAVKEAKYEYGNRGYTGTIAEKDSFDMMLVPGYDPTYDRSLKGSNLQSRLLDAAIEYGIEEVFFDKYGPAGCIDVGNGEYVFFGIAAE